MLELVKGSRGLSFTIIIICYIFAIIVGVIAYTFLPFEYWVNLFVADIVATIFVFVFSVLFKNASIYDPYWSVQPVVIALGYIFYNEFSIVKLLPVIAICIWGIRLTANWAYTFINLNHQDWRYCMLKEKTGFIYPLINLFGIHLFPTFVVYTCVLPVVFLINENILYLNLGCIICFLISIFAITLQGIADIQMHSYRKNRNSNFIGNGLWKYSRHPNYLGEILMWWGIALYVVCVIPKLWYIIFGAFINTLMFIFISIPLADGRQSKKSGFEEYKKQTRMLLPIKK